jgi:uncharacterized SAM-dependent methyltransferase
MNRELGADFDVGGFAHRAFYNPSRSRIEMHLLSRHAQDVQLAGQRIAFAPGETIHTENSYKYTPDTFVALAQEAGFSRHRLWTDPAHWFGVFFLHN